MAQVDWQMKGPWVKNCSCTYGCPCDFNSAADLKVMAKVPTGDKPHGVVYRL